MSSATGRSLPPFWGRRSFSLQWANESFDSSTPPEGASPIAVAQRFNRYRSSRAEIFFWQKGGMSDKRKNRKQRRKDPGTWWDWPLARSGRRPGGKERKDPRIWMEAVWDLRRGLGEHCRDGEPDKLRFQHGRLAEALGERVKAAVGESGDCGIIDPAELIVTLFCCYWFITTFRF